MGRVLIGLVVLRNQCVVPWQLAHNDQDSWDAFVHKQEYAYDIK